MFKALERVATINLKGPSYLVQNRSRPLPTSHKLFGLACGTDIAGDCRANKHCKQDGHMKNGIELIRREEAKVAAIAQLADSVMTGISTCFHS